MKLSAFAAIPAIVLSSASLTQAQTTSAPLQLSQKTEAPGVSLSPGSYTIRVADHLNDRIIVQLQKSGSQNVSTLLAYPNPALTGSGSGPVLFATGLNSKPTLRGFAFSNGPAVEFVYPKGRCGYPGQSQRRKGNGGRSRLRGASQATAAYAVGYE